VGLERGQLSLVSTIEGLLGRKDSGFGLENRCSLYLQKFAVTLPTSGGRSVGIVRSLTQATEFVLFVCFGNCKYRMLCLKPYRYVTITSLLDFAYRPVYCKEHKVSENRFTAFFR
jgi:hypothetical protein